MSIPKVFISYSHDTLEHKQWVLELASRLRTNGVDAILDQWELTAGSDIPMFMEQNLASADYIIMICTSIYVEKANQGKGGVGYEKMIVTSNLMSRIDDAKVIPVVRQEGTRDVPTFLKSKLYIDFSKADEFELSYDNLVRAIHKSPLYKKPEVGDNPFSRIKAKPIVHENDPIKEVIMLFVKALEEEKNWLDGEYLRSKLGVSKTMFKYIIGKLENQGLIELNIYLQGQNYTLTEKGINYAVENGLAE